MNNISGVVANDDDDDNDDDLSELILSLEPFSRL